MEITIIGAGNMAKGIATRAVAGGHSVILLDRTPDKAKALANEVKAAAGDFNGPIASPVVILAVPYSSVIEEVATEFKDRLESKVVVDISNPLNDSYDGLVTPPGRSGAEEIAKLLPTSKVVKAFNTTFAGTLVEGKVADQPLDVFLAGDDAVAKSVVSQLATDGGLRAIDAGPLERSRQLEAMAFLGISLQSTLGTNFMSAWKLLS
jgi:NADPH-dependent F420 reductase